jgi:hypothetical protein
MALDIRAIEALAPDQSSLKAAAGLVKPAKWLGVAGNADGTIIWGMCAGSGANPYKVAVDLRDNGSKCTCPSRKFPCKHGLALMWIKAGGVMPFGTGETPEWVGDWLKRRRGAPVDHGSAGKDAGAAADGDEPRAEDPKATARREAATAKRLADNDAAMTGALEALEQWVSDQLRTGISGFIDDATARCRRIASRMVDGKAPTLAGRIDELPSRLLLVPVGDRIRVALDELSRLILLSRAFRSAPRDPAIRRAVTSAENRETLLADPTAPRVTSVWEVLAERLVTRRDGLISQTTWLLNLGDGPRFAMLLDFHPASAGRRGTSFIQGEQFEAEVAFYPAANPIRALMVRRGDTCTGSPWPDPGEKSIAESVAPSLIADPWCGETPVLLPPGRIVLDAKSAPWWRSNCGRMTHPVSGDVPAVARGAALTSAVAIWSANRLEMLSGATAWGKVKFDA